MTSHAGMEGKGWDTLDQIIFCETALAVSGAFAGQVSL